MSFKDNQTEDVILTKANKHSGDINIDKQFYCKDNCPYCNGETICIKPQYVLPDYDDIAWADIYKNFKCNLCGKEFWEVWGAYVDNYYYPDDDGDYFDEIGDYTDAYYEDRQDAYCESFEQTVKTGYLETVALYKYTVIEPPVDEEEYISELSHKDNYPIYRSLTQK